MADISDWVQVAVGVVRDASGRILRNAAGAPLLIVPTNAGLAYSQLTFIDRGLRAEKEYLRFFPSINAAYNVRENLIARAGYYWSVGRPDYVQYAGSLTLPDTEQPAGPNNFITVNNAAINRDNLAAYTQQACNDPAKNTTCSE